MSFEAVLGFWFEETRPAQWWDKEPVFDRVVAGRFADTLRRGSRGELFWWRTSPRGRLAEIIVLDQFSRNIHRDTPAAFAQDAMALVLSQEAVARGCDSALPPRERAFLYMPYMHSESPVIQRESVRLFAQPELERSLHFARHHRDIIERFGRFPHRNAILGRQSTVEEAAFLRELGSSF